MQCTLAAQVGASSFNIPWSDLKEWKAVLNCAESLSLNQNGTQLVKIDLSDTQRWIAFQAEMNGSSLTCVGYQETVGAMQRGGFSGSNRKVLVWHRPNGTFFIGNEPE